MAAFANSSSERIWRVEDADAEHETHEETADVAEIVEAGKETEDEGDDDVK